MKTNPNESAYPHFKVDEDGTQYVDPGMTGLTKRELISSVLPDLKIEFRNSDAASEFLGRDVVIGLSVVSDIKLGIEIEAKLRVMRADALIKELNKE